MGKPFLSLEKILKKTHYFSDGVSYAYLTPVEILYVADVLGFKPVASSASWIEHAREQKREGDCCPTHYYFYVPKKEAP
jgi:hypothetical protein